MTKTSSAAIWLAFFLGAAAIAGCKAPQEEETPAPDPARGGSPGAGGAPGAGGSPGAGGAPGAGGSPGDAGSAIDNAPPPPKPADPLNMRNCQLIQAGPFVPITSLSLYTYDAPAIMDDKQVYRVTLPPKKEPGHVSFDVATAGEYVIFANSSASLAVFELAGELVKVKNLRTKIPECAEVKGRHVLDLKMGGHIIRIGPDTTPTVDVVITSTSIR